MARLYVWINSDTRKTELTTGGDKEIMIKVNYGSKEDSKKALRVIVQYPTLEAKPIIEIQTAEGLIVRHDNVITIP